MTHSFTADLRIGSDPQITLSAASPIPLAARYRDGRIESATEVGEGSSHAETGRNRGDIRENRGDLWCAAARTA